VGGRYEKGVEDTTVRNGPWNDGGVINPNSSSEDCTIPTWKGKENTRMREAKRET
jgi:hypothetical protein